MLVLTRKLQEQIIISDNIKVTILQIKGNTVRLGIEAPRNVRVIRSELPPERGSAPTSSTDTDHRVAHSTATPAPLPRCPAPLAAFLVGLVANGT